MGYFAGVNLSERGLDIMKELFFYRGMTGKQMVTFITKTSNFTLSQEKSVYNYLRTLKNNGLVDSYRLQDTISRGSIFYLSRKGFELIKDILNIEEGGIGNGTIPVDENTIFGDMSYELHSPPLKQPAHHLMQIEFYSHLIMDQETIIRHRNNLYAAKSYTYKGEKNRLRPDAEVSLPTGLCCIEIDRATETHEQLVQKFETYKRYLDYCDNDNSTKRTPIKTILFVVEGKKREYGIRRRWNNVLSAFYKGMKERYWEINLILTTLDEVKRTMHIEKNKRDYEAKAITRLDKLQIESGFFRKGARVLKRNDESTYICAHYINQQDRTYKVVFFAFSHEFESDIYNKHITFEENVFPNFEDAKFFEGIDGLDIDSVEKYVFCNETVHLENKFDHYDVEKERVVALNKLKNDLKVIQLIN